MAKKSKNLNKKIIYKKLFDIYGLYPDINNIILDYVMDLYYSQTKKYVIQQLNSTAVIFVDEECAWQKRHHCVSYQVLENFYLFKQFIYTKIPFANETLNRNEYLYGIVMYCRKYKPKFIHLCYSHFILDDAILVLN